MERHTLDVPAVAKILGISVSSAYLAVQRGELPALKYGKRYVVPIVEVERLIGRSISDASVKVE